MPRIKYLYLYLILVFSSLLLYYINSEILISEDLIKEHFNSKLSYERILKMISVKKEWAWVNYLLIPAFQLMKLSIISFWILCGSILFNFKTSFSSIFKVVMISDFIWLLPSIIQIFWFGLFDSSYTLAEIQYFAPFSLLSLFDPSKLDSWLIFPLKSLNLFEVVYLLALATGIKKIIKKDYDSALKFTLPVYGSALVVWILFITFLSINLGA